MGRPKSDIIIYDEVFDGFIRRLHLKKSAIALSPAEKKLLLMGLNHYEKEIESKKLVKDHLTDTEMLVLQRIRSLKHKIETD